MPKYKRGSGIYILQKIFCILGFHKWEFIGQTYAVIHTRCKYCKINNYKRR
jgi:hypothetical protein